MERQSKDPAEWIEIIYTGEFDPATGMRSLKSESRALGEAAFLARGAGGTNTSGGTSFTFEIPAGARLHVRNVKLLTEPTEPTLSYLWVYVMVLVAVAVAGLGTLVVWTRRRRARGT